MVNSPAAVNAISKIEDSIAKAKALQEQERGDYCIAVTVLDCIDDLLQEGLIDDIKALLPLLPDLPPRAMGAALLATLPAKAELGATRIEFIDCVEKRLAATWEADRINALMRRLS